MSFNLKNKKNYIYALLILIVSCSPSEPESMDFVCLEEMACELETNITINGGNCDHYTCNENNDPGCSNTEELCSSNKGCHWDVSSQQCDYALYYCNDLIILQEFININSQTYKHYLDEDGNGCSRCCFDNR